MYAIIVRETGGVRTYAPTLRAAQVRLADIEDMDQLNEIYTKDYYAIVEVETNEG